MYKEILTVQTVPGDISHGPLRGAQFGTPLEALPLGGLLWPPLEWGCSEGVWGKGGGRSKHNIKNEGI